MEEIAVKDIDGMNCEKPVVSVKHEDLERVRGSFWMSECPTCGKGLITVGRESDDLRLSERDSCLLCGQRYVYADINEMRTKDF